MRPVRLLPILLVAALVAGCRENPLAPDPEAARPEGTAAVQAEASPSQARSPERVPNRFLVVFKDNVAAPGSLGRSLAAANGGAVRHTYRHTVRGFALELPEGTPAQAAAAVVNALQRNPNVAYVEQDQVWYLDTHVAPAVMQQAPAVPSDLTATAQSSSEIALGWTDTSNDERGFQVSRCTGAGCTDFVEVDRTGKNATSFVDTGLSPETEYCYEVRSVGGKGRNTVLSDPAGPACATTDAGTDPPAPNDERPSDLVATASGDVIDLSWTDNWDAESGYEIERCAGASCTGFGWIAEVGTDVTAYTDPGLTEGEYCYRVRGIKARRKKTTTTEYSNVDCAVASSTSANQAPVASFTWSAADLTVSFTDTSTDGDGTVVGWSWDFGDSENSTEQNPSHSYGAAGDFPVTLTVTDDGGETGVSSQTVTASDTPPPPSPDRFVDDSFEDVAGTALESHTGETGATWAQHPSSVSTATFAPGGGEVQAFTEALYVASGVPPGPDYRVASRFHFFAASGSNVTYTFVSGRTDASSKTMYAFGFVYSWVNRWELKKFVNGSESTLAYSTQSLPTAGDTPLVELQMEGSTIRGVVDGVEILSVTDVDITSLGQAGLRMKTDNQGFATMTDFEATTLDLAPPPPPPDSDPPSDLTATAQSATSVGLTWTDNSEEDSFEIERCVGPGCSSFSALTSVSANTTAYTDAGLTEGQQVCYRVRGIVQGTPTGYSNVACETPGTAPPVFVSDSYEDGAGTLLQSHVGETGGTWTSHPTTLGDARFAAGGSEVYSTDEALYTAAGFPPGANYRVASTMRFHDVQDGAVTYSFVAGRADQSSKTMYMFGFVYSSVNRWELKKFVNGSESFLGSSTEKLPLVDDTRLVEIRMDGSTIKGVVNGYELITVTDADITDAGRAGLRVRSGDLRWAALTDFEATTLDLAPPPIPPSTDPPSDLAATPYTATTVGLSWTDASDEELFEVERCEGTGCGNFLKIADVNRNATSFTDTGLTGGNEYCYRVRGVVEGVPTDYSGTACATPIAPPPGTCPDAGNHDDLSALWGITRTGAPLNAVWQGTQQGGDCAIQGWYFGIDSGVDSDHPDLNVVETIDFLLDGSGAEDGNGHGTHTAGTATAIDGNGGVVGMAPGAPVYGFKVCGADGSCSLSGIIAAVDEVTARKQANPSQPMVANMSLGGDPSPTLEQAVRRSVAAGVPYAMGAGNGIIGACWLPADAAGFSPALVGDDDITPTGGTNGDGKPLNGAIAVTSSDENDWDANCNYGAPVTVAAPGTNIYSSGLDGGYYTTGGTSMATPHVAGAILLYLQNQPGATPTQIELAIVSLLDPWTTDDLPNASGRLAVESF